MTVPLQLHPDYIKIENKDKEPEAPVVIAKRRAYRRSGIPANQHKKIGMSQGFFHSMKGSNPTRYRFVQFHGKGDLAAGVAIFNMYWDNINRRVGEMIDTLKQRRRLKAFAEYVGDIDPSLLSQYAGSRRNVTNRRWDRLLNMRKIVRNYDGLMEGVSDDN